MTEPAAPRPRLSLFDAVMIIMGIMIGSAIYELTPLHCRQRAHHCGRTAGRMARRRLAGAWPEHSPTPNSPRPGRSEGGEYVYLTRAYSPSAGTFVRLGRLLDHPPRQHRRHGLPVRHLCRRTGAVCTLSARIPPRQLRTTRFRSGPSALLLLLTGAQCAGGPQRQMDPECSHRMPRSVGLLLVVFLVGLLLGGASGLRVPETPAVEPKFELSSQEQHAIGR